MPINLNEYSLVDLNYFIKKFEVDIDELREQIADAKGTLTKRLEKSNLSEGELNDLEADVQKAKAILTHLTNTNADAGILADQQAKVAKAEAELSEKKRKGGLISDREAFLDEVAIEELEMKIKLREDKIVAIKAIV